VDGSFYEHEWNHYKNYMFGSMTTGLTPQETWLLGFYDEMSSQMVNELSFRDMLLQEIAAGRGEFYNDYDTSLMERDYHRYLVGSIRAADSADRASAAKRMLDSGLSAAELRAMLESTSKYLLESAHYRRQFISGATGILVKSVRIRFNHKKLFNKIARDLFVLYSGGVEIDLLKFDGLDPISQISAELLKNPDVAAAIVEADSAAKEIIMSRRENEAKIAQYKKAQKKFEKEQAARMKQISRLEKQIARMKKNMRD
jgi:hypothetical protein